MYDELSGSAGRFAGLERAGPAPAGFPDCPRCPYRWRREPAVCLACMEASAGQGTGTEGAGHGGDAGEAAAGEGGALVRCPSCGARHRRGRPCPTRWCGRADRGWSVVWSVGVHAGALKSVILRYKYGGERAWAGVLGRLLAGYLDRYSPWFDDFDLLTPMPAFTGPGARRAWDPVRRMVTELSLLAGPLWTVGWDLVDKTTETPPMSGADRRTRQSVAARQLRQALTVPDPAAVSGARILVVDDVLAEGSTLREVALTLRAAGAREVAGLVVARPEWLGGSPTAPAR